jgi:UTP--glucose-1-phosphate uridylyltransferase
VKVKGLVEKPAPEKAPSTLSIIGRYILQPEVFEHLSAFETGAGGEIQLTDAMAKLIGKQPFHGLRFDGQHYDCGSRLGFIEANIAYMMNDKGIGAQVRKIVKAYAAQEK